MIFKDTTYQEIVNRRGPDFVHETNDCAVVALMHVGSMPYGAAHRELKESGARPRDRKGTNVFKYLLSKKNAQGDTWVANYSVKNIYSMGPFSKMTVNQFMRMHPKGRFLVVTHRHGFAVVDGVAYQASGKRARVHYVWEFVPR
jgi:hypothetical protein